ncbi:hypothetical protein BD779DRAFT_1557053 [Infundibulicybe gibba]|nr:hypothetical protein BD779DRAFT_1557053 [Infundibulicybe gibba]
MRCIALLNRADPDMLIYTPTRRAEGRYLQTCQRFRPVNNTHEVIGQPPLYKDGRLEPVPRLIEENRSILHRRDWNH